MFVKEPFLSSGTEVELLMTHAQSFIHGGQLACVPASGSGHAAGVAW
jgi:hypothetical protein